jgi:uncharacterized repeat protein (TIGR01451 family)
MNAAVADNVATITFDVVVYPDVPDGTVISNQAFLDSPPYGIADQPSDDPRTAVPDDPTRDVVGNFPLLFAPKSAALAVDNGTPGIVDPGDTLRYTIQVYNNGAVPATIARLADVVPNDVTYVPDTRRVPAHRPHRHQLGRPAVAGRRRGRANAGRIGGRAVRHAGQPGRAHRHADRQPGRRLHG